MIRIAVVIGSLLASTAAYAANLMQSVDTNQDDQTGYMPFPWDNEDDGCES